MSIYSKNYVDSALESENNDNENNNSGSGRMWITPEGWGEIYQSNSCHSQCDVRHIVRNGRYVTLCSDCRATYAAGDSR